MKPLLVKKDNDTSINKARADRHDFNNKDMKSKNAKENTLRHDKFGMKDRDNCTKKYDNDDSNEREENKDSDETELKDRNGATGDTNESYFTPGGIETTEISMEMLSVTSIDVDNRVLVTNDSINETSIESSGHSSTAVQNSCSGNTIDEYVKTTVGSCNSNRNSENSGYPVDVSGYIPNDSACVYTSEHSDPYAGGGV